MIVLLLIGVFILVWSMNRHLKKLPKTFDTDAEPAETAQTGDADGARPRRWTPREARA